MNGECGIVPPVIRKSSFTYGKLSWFMFQEVEFVVDIHPQYDSIFLVNELMISTRLLTWTRGT